MVRRPKLLLGFAALIAMLSFALALSVAVSAATMSDLVGRWFGEITEDATFDGEPYDMRRQIEDNRSDGTKSVTFRFYKNCRYLGELINNHRWGVTNNVYWARCTSIESRSGTFPCDAIQEHDILSVSKTELSYKSKDAGTVYNHTRIGSDFKLPTTSCVGNIFPAEPWRHQG